MSSFIDKRTQPGETLIYHTLEDGISVKCGICKHECTIKPEETGTCGLRINKDGKLINMIYGYLCSIHFDPIEKKPLHHFLPGSDILSIGSYGCNFQCKFCQNWTISQNILHKKKNLKQSSIPEEAIEKEIEDLCGNKITPQSLIAKCKSRKTPSIAFTYNEPTTFVEYAWDVMKLCKENGIKTVFVSNGFQTPEMARALAPMLGFNSKWYKKTCNSSLEGVCDSIKLWHELGVHLEVTTLVIEGHNDSNEELKQIADFISSVSPYIVWHISAARPDYQMQDIHRTTFSTLKRAYDIGKKAGLKYIYTGCDNLSIYIGNTNQTDYVSTYCSNEQCKTLLIERRYMDGDIKKNFDINTGTCKKCGEKIHGIWK